MAAPSTGIKDILVTKSVGIYDINALMPAYAVDSDYRIFISKMPDAPDRVIAIFDTGGAAPSPRWLLDFPDVTVYVRGVDYSNTYDKMVAVKNALLGYPSGSLNGDQWVSVTQIGEFGLIGYDAKNRPQFSATFRLIIEPAASTSSNRDPL